MSASGRNGIRNFVSKLWHGWQHGQGFSLYTTDKAAPKFKLCPQTMPPKVSPKLVYSSNFNKWSIEQPKYDIDFKVQCPACGEDIQVGFAGPAGLVNHQGKSRCQKTVATKAKIEKMAKRPTLFHFSITKKPEGQKATENQNNDDRSMVRPMSWHYAKGGLETQVNEGEECHLGCKKAWNLLRKLRKAANVLEDNANILVAGPSDALSGYSKAGAATTYDTVNNEEIWEMVNPGLDRLLGFGKSKEEVCSLLRRGPRGVTGLCSYFEYLVEEKGVVGELLEGKINILLEAMKE